MKSPNLQIGINRGCVDCNHWSGVCMCVCMCVLCASTWGWVGGEWGMRMRRWRIWRRYGRWRIGRRCERGGGEVGEVDKGKVGEVAKQLVWNIFDIYFMSVFFSSQVSGTVVNITSLLAVWVEHTDLTVLGFRI